MSLESCPKCGYALSVIDHQCRHCTGISQSVSKFAKRETPLAYAAIVALVALSFAIYWAFFR